MMNEDAELDAMMREMNDTFTPAQIRSFRRAAFTPDKIILGQIVMTKSAAEKLADMGLWEKFSETPSNSKNPQPRYRFTIAGLAAYTRMMR
jgi:hypothetical protein